MKHFLLIILTVFSFFSFGQNPPIAVDDTVYFEFYQTSSLDTALISYFELLKNDSDPNGNSLIIESYIYTGSHYLGTELNTNGSIKNFRYSTPVNFIGAETFQYIIANDAPTPLKDTATVTIIIKNKTYEFLDANNINAILDKNVLFSSPRYSNPGFEVPNNSNSVTIYASNLWVAGKNGATVYSNLRKHGDFASSSINNSGWSGFISNSGPVSNISHTDSLVNSRWDRVWKVKQFEIDYHLANWNTSGYNPPPSFMEWPAHGDTLLGEPYYVAPFVDYDGDGTYNPYLGDYPQIKGDQAVYFVYNDGLSYYSTNEMITEVHGLAYAFQCQDSALQNTIFVDFKIVNRSNNTYDSTYFGMFCDLEVGNAMDDNVQSDVDRGLFFGYNGDQFDDDNNGRPGYGYYPPAQAVVTLKGAKQDNDGQDNAVGIGVNETVNGTGFGDGVADNEYWGMEYFQYFVNGGPGYGSDPRTENEFYNFMHGIWRDNTNQVFGGTGHQNSPNATSIATRFAFPDSSDTYNYGTGGIAMPAWSEDSAGTNPSDKRGVSSTGPITFAPGDEIELTYAYVFGRDYVNMGVQAGVNNMLERADSIRSYYDQGMLAACGFPVSVKNLLDVKSDVVIYPNPTNNVINIRQDKAVTISIQVLDITGKVLLTTSSKNQLTIIDFSEFTNGVYLVKVSTGNETMVQKVIKN